MNSNIDPTKLDIISASFYWKNDQPNGLGFTFGPPGFTPQEVQAMFFGPEAKQYMRDSDKALGTMIVSAMLAQLEGIAFTPPRQRNTQMAILAALNIMWLSDRGFIPQNEFNGTQFIGGMK